MSRVDENYISLVSGVPGLFGLTASAVVIAPGLAVTNGHVVKISSQFAGFTKSRGMVRTEVIAVSERMDLALLRVPTDLGTPLPVGRAVANETIWAMGTTGGLVSPVAEGRIVRIDGWACTQGVSFDGANRSGEYDCSDPSITGMMLAAEGGPGYSGGPVVNSRGELVGITQSQYLRVYDDNGRELHGLPTMLFAYRTADVLGEARRLLAAAADLPPAERGAALARLDQAMASAEQAQPQQAGGSAR